MIIDQEVGMRRGRQPAKLRRRQQAIDLAGDRGEIEVGRQALDQPVDLRAAALDEPSRVAFEALRISRRRHRGEQPVDEIAARRGKARDVAQAAEPAQAAVVAALQRVDRGVVDVDQLRAVEIPVEPVQALDQEPQPPLLVVEVERLQEPDPAGQRRCRGTAARWRIRLVGRAGLHGPGLDDRRHHGEERRLRRGAAQRDDDAADGGAHVGELERHVAFIGKSLVARGQGGDPLAGGADIAPR